MPQTMPGGPIIFQDTPDASSVKSVPSIVVDGDRTSRNVLCSQLEHDPEINFLGAFDTERQVRDILREYPDLLLWMDVNMPAFDSLRFLRHIGFAAAPTVILIASDTQHVMDALQLHLFGYLLRPLSESVISDNLHAAKRQFERYQAKTTPNSGRTVSNPSSRLVLRSRGRFTFLRTDEIDWIEAKGNYVRVHAGSVSLMERRTLTSLEAQLDPDTFVRIHKSSIVNIDKIRELRVWPTGEYVVLMRNGKELTLTRHYRDRLSLLVGRQNLVQIPEGDPLILERMILGS